MATYYRWRQSVVSYTSISAGNTSNIGTMGNKLYVLNGTPSISNGAYNFSNASEINFSQEASLGPNIYIAKSKFPTTIWKTQYYCTLFADGTISVSVDVYTIKASASTQQGYVYSTSSSAYPNGGVQGDYYYDQRTTITSPTAPTGLTYPNPITAPTVNVSWPASVSNIPSYSVSTYEVSYATNGGSNWKVAGTPTAANLDVTIPVGITSIQFRVRAKDSNGQWSTYATGPVSTVLMAPTLTVPSIAMQGQDITVNWTAIEGAASCTLQRKADTDDDWVQVYSGDALTFTETAGGWTAVQYRIQALFDGTLGGWATSASIPVVSASALVISGQNEDLGTLTKDVPYTVSSDTGNSITLTRKVNGNLVATLTIQSGFAYTIPVMDLPTGSGTIEITATVHTAGGEPVSASRTWTYTKTAITFPNRAGVGQLVQNEANVFPATLAEAVRVPTNWGGSLDKALELLYPAVNSAVISVGSYEGTGTFGQDNPSKLTFDKTPLVVTIYGGGQTLVISSTDPGASAYISGDQTVWYSTESAAAQMNTDGTTYSYVAVGKQV